MNANNEKLRKALGEKFGFTIANNGSSDVKVALTHANFPVAKANTSTGEISYNDASEITAAGYSVDCVLDDGTIATNVTATAINPAFRIRHFQQYRRFNPLVIKDMTIQANNSDFFQQSLTIAYVSPLSDMGKQHIPLNDFYNVNQSSTTKIEIQDLNMPVDDTTLMIVTIPAGRTVTFTMKF